MEAKTQSTKLTTQKLHSVVRDGIGIKCSLHSPSQRINRTTYDIYSQFKTYYVLTSTQYMEQIQEVLNESGIKFQHDERRGVLCIPKVQ
jgi:hypothetical protein